jgi:hypothetical protein
MNLFLLNENNILILSIQLIFWLLVESNRGPKQNKEQNIHPFQNISHIVKDMYKNLRAIVMTIFEFFTSIVDAKTAICGNETHQA